VVVPVAVAEVADPDFAVDDDGVLLQPATDTVSVVAASTPASIV
jgi:hypothetical protein